MTSQMPTENPPLCNECGLPKTWWRNRDDYYYWMCHPCKHKKYPAKELTARKYNLKKKGITVEWFNSMLDKQGGVCAICKQPQTEVRNGKVIQLNVDHDHNHCKNGCPECIRGLLCSNCNRGIGKFYDRIDLLENAIKYLMADLPESV